MGERRQVRVGQRFFDQLDAQLGKTRDGAGSPSSTDFLLQDLPFVAEIFALRFDDLPEPIPGRPDYLIAITAGRLVPGLSVTGQLLFDGSIVLLGVKLDLTGTW